MARFDYNDRVDAAARRRLQEAGSYKYALFTLKQDVANAVTDEQRQFANDVLDRIRLFMRDQIARQRRNRSGGTRNRSGNAADHRKFVTIKNKWFKNRQKQQEFEHELFARYGKHDPPRNWLKSSDLKKRESIQNQASKISNEMHELLERVSPRNWGSGVAAHWIMDNLTWDDAISTGQLSMIPYAGYGYSQADMDRFARGIQ